MDLPEPEGPTIAVDYPAFILKDAFSSTGLNSSGAVGYLNVIFSKDISFFKLIPYPIMQLY